MDELQIWKKELKRCKKLRDALLASYRELKPLTDMSRKAEYDYLASVYNHYEYYRDMVTIMIADQKWEETNG